MSLQSLIATGTKLWLDSVDPQLVRENRQWGATGATSNPIIIADILKTGRYDDQIAQLAAQGMDDHDIAWELTDRIVRDAQQVFLPVWEQTAGNDGYVSFELDPLLEDPDLAPPLIQRIQRYIELGRKWSAGHPNRLIKVPATEAGLAALEELAAWGVKINVTLIFTQRQYLAARDAIWRGLQRRPDRADFKSVYSIFISRVDVYTEQHIPQLTPAAQGMVGIVNVKRIWRTNQAFWQRHPTPLQQEIIFASTGVKKPGDPPDKYVEALAGSGIQTNPPATNQAIRQLNKTYQRTVDQMPPLPILDEIDREVDIQMLERILMEEGIEKFAHPQRDLLTLIRSRHPHP